MKEPNLVAGNDCLDFVSTVEAIIRRSCIIDYGIVQKIVADGVVDVSVAVSDTEQNMFCMTCVLAGIASKSITIDIKPAIGDRVLVVYPRIYDDDMFAVTDSESDNKKIKINPSAKGYNLCGGIAILLNQYKTSGHKNVVTVDEGNITAKLNKVEVTTTSDGDITVKNPNATINIDKDGNVSVDTKGKYTVKNTSTNLAEVISKLADEIENLVIVCPNGAGSVNPSSVTKIELWKTQTLNALFNAQSIE